MHALPSSSRMQTATSTVRGPFRVQSVGDDHVLMANALMKACVAWQSSSVVFIAAAAAAAVVIGSVNVAVLVAIVLVVVADVRSYVVPAAEKDSTIVESSS